MKTIKQIAEDLGVSKTAIRKKITPEIRNQFAETIGNTVFINEEGEALIKSTFHKTTENRVSANDSETFSRLVAMLQSELDAKNQQISEQARTITDLSQALVNAQTLHAATVQQRQLESKPKKSWWPF
jgi:predicted transcriptional regulator